MKIELKGVAYDVELTMGAIMDYERQTGKKVTDISSDFASFFELLYYCLRSTCRRNGTTLELSEEQVYDSIDASMIPSLTEAFSKLIEEAFQKKMNRSQRRKTAAAKK